MIGTLIKVIKESTYILLAAHENPDGDAIGSLVGMAQICKFFKKPYTVLLENIPESYAFLIKDTCTKTGFTESYDTFISLDCGAVERLSHFKTYFEKAKNTINIDHHETNNGFGDYNYIQKDASSTAELVFNVAAYGKVALNQTLCEALFAGMVTDTGGFMHSCTQSSTHLAVAKLMEVPFDFTTIYYKLIHEKTEKTVFLQGLAAGRLTKMCEGKVFLSYIEPKDLEACDASREEASSFVSYIKNIQGCEVAVFIYPGNIQGTYKLSLRSNAPHNVAQFAELFGGGGHIRAAGATITGQLEEVMEHIKNKLDF